MAITSKKIKDLLAPIIISISILANCATKTEYTRQEEKIIEEHNTNPEILDENQKLLNKTLRMLQELQIKIVLFLAEEGEKRIKVFQKISNDIKEIEDNLTILEKKGIDTKIERSMLGNIKNALETERVE